ncbi:MAG: D-alanyl-D-alanine carboxypeptidase family protein [Oscillospiraceae bacterium]|nr:D-alanyl-D-alanine carboxypeptidase family protein [Oscillospiraceae bacterium]
MRGRKRTKQQHVIFAIVAVCLLLVAGIWVIDAVLRFFYKPQDIINYISDEREISEKSVISMEEPEQTETTTNDSGTFGSDNMKINKADMGIPKGYKIIQKEWNSIHSGSLLQLDNYHEFTGTVNTLTGLEQKNNHYRLRNMTLQVQTPVVNAMNELAEAYHEFSGRDDLMIYSTTEVYATQGSLYPDILPDRSTGYCLDLAFLNNDGSISKITANNNGWLVENAYRFGFIFSYTETNQDKTGISPAPYHLRYVGKAHASLMQESHMDLHTYLNTLQSYEVNNYFSYEAKNVSIYYVKAENSGMTNVPVPDGENYDISGNNTDGYIICVYNTVN